MLLQHADYRTQSVFDTDILVIGTGAGGAVVGAELAEAGFDVTFVEEGSYVPTSSFSPYSANSVARLYRDGGATVIMGRPPIPFMEGRAVGGSTVVNGGMCYRAPDDVLRDWQTLTGSPELGSEGMRTLFERVETNVHAKHHHSVAVAQTFHVGANRRHVPHPFVTANRRVVGLSALERVHVGAAHSAIRDVDHHTIRGR